MHVGGPKRTTLSIVSLCELKTVYFTSTTDIRKENTCN